VAGPAGFLGGAEEDGVFECLGGTLAAGAGGWGIAVPGRVATEVAFTRSLLMYAARGELVEAHEWVRFERGRIGVSSQVRSGLVPFLHEEVLALEFELGVGAARGGLGVVVGEQMLRGNWEGREPLGAQYKQH